MIWPAPFERRSHIRWQASAARSSAKCSTRGCGWSASSRTSARIDRGTGFERQRPERQCKCPAGDADDHDRATRSLESSGRSETNPRWPGMLLNAWNRRHLLWKFLPRRPAAAADSPDRDGIREARAEAIALNARHRWATDDEFEALLPTIASREEVSPQRAALSQGWRLPSATGRACPPPAAGPCRLGDRYPARRPGVRRCAAGGVAGPQHGQRLA